MKTLQNELVAANDAAMARQVLANLRSRALKPSALKLVHNWSEQQVRKNISLGQAVWRKFQDTEPFRMEPKADDSGTRSRSVTLNMVTPIPRTQGSAPLVFPSW